MRALRFLLLAASIVGAVFIFHVLRSGGIESGDRSIVRLFGIGLVLNAIYLLFCGPVSAGRSRFAYLIRLWYDAKMRELRERAGNPPQ
jgi:hypothetical protein